MVINDAPIDDLILSAIMILNEKGYETKYSCSGHVEDAFRCDGCRKYGYARCEGYKKLKYKQANAYVSFSDEKMHKYIRGYKKVRLPHSYHIEQVHVIRAYFCGTDEDIDVMIKKSAKALERWAKRLPKFEDMKKHVEENMEK